MIFLGIYQCCHNSDYSLSQTVLQSRCKDKICCGTPCAKPESTYTKLLNYQLPFTSLSYMTGLMCQNVTPTQKEERTSASYYMPYDANTCILSPSIRDMPTPRTSYSQEATELLPGQGGKACWDYVTSMLAGSITDSSSSWKEYCHVVFRFLKVTFY